MGSQTSQGDENTLSVVIITVVTVIAIGVMIAGEKHLLFVHLCSRCLTCIDSLKTTTRLRTSIIPTVPMARLKLSVSEVLRAA